MNKLAEFPLAAAGYKSVPDDTVIVAWPSWSLTVGDVRSAMASKGGKTPQHSVTEQALDCDDLLATPFRERFTDAYHALSVAAFASAFWNQSMEELLASIDGEINRRAATRAQPLASAAAKLPTNDEVFAEVNRLRDAVSNNRYVSTNAVNDTMQAVRSLMASTAASVQQASVSDAHISLEKLPRYNGASIAHVAAWKFKEFVELDALRAALSGRSTIPSEAASEQPRKFDDRPEGWWQGGA